jgi:hypothetical protein
MVRLCERNYRNKQQVQSEERESHTILRVSAFNLETQTLWLRHDERARENCSLLRQLFVKSHSLDMRIHVLAWFQREVRKRLSRNAGDERRADIQKHVY